MKQKMKMENVQNLFCLLSNLLNVPPVYRSVNFMLNIKSLNYLVTVFFMYQIMSFIFPNILKKHFNRNSIITYWIMRYVAKRYISNNASNFQKNQISSYFQDAVQKVSSVFLDSPIHHTSKPYLVKTHNYKKFVIMQYVLSY